MGAPEELCHKIYQNSNSWKSATKLSEHNMVAKNVKRRYQLHSKKRTRIAIVNSENVKPRLIFSRLICCL